MPKNPDTAKMQHRGDNNRVSTRFAAAFIYTQTALHAALTAQSL
jgi:hypothetical protein